MTVYPDVTRRANTAGRCCHKGSPKVGHIQAQTQSRRYALYSGFTFATREAVQDHVFANMLAFLVAKRGFARVECDGFEAFEANGIERAVSVGAMGELLALGESHVLIFTNRLLHARKFGVRIMKKVPGAGQMSPSECQRA